MKKFLLVLLLIILPSIASSQIILTAKVGFEGKCKPNQWTPIMVEADNPDGDIKGRFTISTPYNSYGSDITEWKDLPYVFDVHIPKETKSRYWLYLPFEQYPQELKLNLVVNHKTIAATNLFVNTSEGQNAIVLGAVKDKSISNAEIPVEPQESPCRKIILVSQAILPDEWIGYDGVFRVLIDNTSLQQLTPKQNKSLDQWACLKGKIINIDGMTQEQVVSLLKKEATQSLDFNARALNIGDLLSNIPQMRVPSPGVIFLLLFIYILIMGPGNYLILKWKKRYELSWISIPAIVILFGLAFFIFGVTIKGTKTILNEISVLQVPTGKNWGVLESYLGLFSPRRASYTFSFRPQTFISLPGDSYMDLSRLPYKILQSENESRLTNFIIKKWCMRTITTHSILCLDGHINIWLTDNKLTVKNSSNYKLLDCGIVMNGVYRSLGEIKAGSRQENVRIDRLKIKKDFQAKKIIRYEESENLFLGWFEKPIARLEIPGTKYERKGRALLITPVVMGQ
ncbi:MAG: hypothetical protein ABH870_07380 [bacterium]